MHNRNSKIYCDCKKVANDKRPLTFFFFTLIGFVYHSNLNLFILLVVYLLILHPPKKLSAW